MNENLLKRHMVQGLILHQSNRLVAVQEDPLNESSSSKPSERSSDHDQDQNSARQELFSLRLGVEYDTVKVTEVQNKQAMRQALAKMSISSSCSNSDSASASKSASESSISQKTYPQEAYKIATKPSSSKEAYWAKELLQPLENLQRREKSPEEEDLPVQICVCIEKDNERMILGKLPSNKKSKFSMMEEKILYAQEF